MKTNARTGALSQLDWSSPESNTLKVNESILFLFLCDNQVNFNFNFVTLLAITCQDPEGAPHLITTCSSSSPELRLGSTCSFDCAAGFVLQGADSVLCSDDGRWSGAIPTCKGMEAYLHTYLYIQLHIHWASSQPTRTSPDVSFTSFAAMECPAPEVPTSGQICCSLPLSSPASPETPHPLGMVCTFTCDEGHELEGAPSMECEHPGQWTSSPPTCTGINMWPFYDVLSWCY